MNGKQKAILIPIFIGSGLITAIFGYGKLSEKVQTNVRDIVEIKEDTKKIPAIEADVKHILCEQKEMKEDIRTIRTDMNNGFQEILRAVQ